MNDIRAIVKEKRHQYYLAHKERNYETSMLWRKNNRERHLEYLRNWSVQNRAKVRMEVLAHYGNKCACCEEDNPRFLTIDHIEGGGRQHRKKLNLDDMYAFAKKQKFPKYLQLLCFNCNYGKSLNKNICPHRNETKI